MTKLQVKETKTPLSPSAYTSSRLSVLMRTGGKHTLQRPKTAIYRRGGPVQETVGYDGLAEIERSRRQSTTRRLSPQTACCVYCLLTDIHSLIVNNSLLLILLLLELVFYTSVARSR